ncbi:glycoside hydrolase family 28 protein [uncultured Muribaculum sp.]|uniref:glycoside hydrolase family 28 protein n=1 Tax=uncultured Muribaculum sp. TaxID=1918613 RepID=UPI002597614F|nr:glycoside hydrolase family 28 protein [uncultured Muribaculum sp.]
MTIPKSILTASIAALLIFTGSITATAADYAGNYQNLPFEASAPELPEIPALTVKLDDFGGKGDGITLNTSCFAAAIEHLSSKGGGHLVVPEGVWLTGPIVMKSNIDLHIEKNAILLFSDNKDLFPLLPPDEGTAGKLVQPLISANHQSNFSITGEGVIDGNGEAWRPIKRFKVSDAEWKKLNRKLKLKENEYEGSNVWFPVKSDDAEISTRRPRLIRIVECDRFLIQGIVAQNSPNFHVNLILSRNFIIDNVMVRCPWNAQNGDGIDLSSCQNALLVNCGVDAGDDAICLKSGTGDTGRMRGPCRNIVINNCTVYHGHGGFVIGSDNSGGMNNISVTNCRFIDTDTGLRFKSGRDRGGLMTDIFVDNIMMCDIADEAILFDCYYQEKVGDAADAPAAPVTADTPRFDGITIKNIVCRDAHRAILIKGLPEMNVKNVAIENCTFTAQRGATINHATNIKLENVTFNIDETQAITSHGSSDIVGTNVTVLAK